MHYLTLFGLFLLLTTANAQGGPYTMADLEALEAQGNYREFLDHALDIRPSERGEAWQEMVSTMAIGLIDFHLSRSRLSREMWLYLDQLSLWPNLRSDEFFQTKLANYLRAYLPYCLKQNLPKELCAQDVTKYWKNSPKDPDLGIWIASLNTEHQLGLEPELFLAKVGLHELSEFYCRRPVVQQFLLAQLLTPLAQKELTSPQVNELIDRHTNATCYAQLVLPLKDLAQTLEDSVVVAESAFRLLTAKDQLSEAEVDLFLTSYLLNGPVVGPTFNMAWSRLRELGQNYQRRTRVLKELTERPHLPDALFAQANQEQKRVVMSFFHRHFPEYFNHYAKTCLAYYQGTKQFPRGNPTLHCSEFFAESKENSLVEQSLQLQYSGIKKAR